MDLAFAKELYYKELDIKAQQDQRLATHLLILSLVGGALGFLVRELPETANWVQTVATLAGVCLFGIGFYNVFRATINHEYEIVPAADHLLKYHNDLANYHQFAHPDEGSANNAFESYLVRHLASAAAGSRACNLRRSAHYHRSSLFAAWAMVATSVAVIAMQYRFLLNLVLSPFC